MHDAGGGKLEGLGGLRAQERKYSSENRGSVRAGIFLGKVPLMEFTELQHEQSYAASRLPDK